MANIKSFPNNQDDFIGAEEVMKWLHGRTSGVFAAGGQCAVAAVADSMSITVSDGNGWMANSEGDGIVWWISNEKDTGTKLTITGDMADATLPRIDRIVVSWPTTNYVGLPTVEFKKGTPASNPVPPALTNNNIMRQISLAQIRIPAGATAIANSMITDERLDPTVCGIVTESIQVDTSVINAQLLAAYEEYTRNMDQYTAESRAAFEAWFEAVKDALSGDVAGNLQNQINELREAAEAYKVENKTYVDTLGLVTATHAKTGTAHALTAPAGCGNLKFVAAAPYEDGDTITLNGIAVTPKTQDGEDLTGGAWAAGAVVMCLVSPDGGTLFFRGGGGGSGKSEIIVTAPSGSTVTATMGSVTKTAVEKNGVWTFRGCGIGEWTLTATHPDEAEPATETISITEDGQLMRYHVDISFWDGSLYNNGNQYTDITGGWTHVDGAGMKTSFGSSRIKMVVIGEAYIESTVYTKNKIDISGKNTLTVDVKNIVHPVEYSAPGVYIGLTNARTSSFPSFVAEKFYSSTVGRTIALDISNLSGEYYVAVSCDVASADIISVKIN